MFAPHEMGTEKDLYEWLGTDSRGVPYHLHPLNHVWSPEGIEYDLQVYRTVAERLRADPLFWSACLRGAYGWRPTLVGSVCLLLTRERDFFGSLSECFEHGSFVQPQVAVTLGQLHPVESRTFFEAFLNIPEYCTSARAVVSAQRVLHCLGALSESAIVLTGWPVGQQDDAILANNVVIQHWGFWSSRNERDA